MRVKHTCIWSVFIKKRRLQRVDTSPVMLSESENKNLCDRFLWFFGYFNGFECPLLFLYLHKVLCKGYWTTNLSILFYIQILLVFQVIQFLMKYALRYFSQNYFLKFLNHWFPNCAPRIPRVSPPVPGGICGYIFVISTTNFTYF